MPELPEVETMCRGLTDLVGATIVRAARPPCRRRPIVMTPAMATLRRRLVGQCVAAIDRLGKRVVLRFVGDDRLMIEPRMTGLVLLGEPPTRAHLRLQLNLRRGRQHYCMLFWDRRGLGQVHLVPAKNFEAWQQQRALGPDALRIGADELRRKLAFSRRAIKVALLDQSVLAGVGNLYASELLHRARIDPRKSCARLAPQEWNRLHRCLRRVLREAIRHEGSTLADGTYRKSLQETGRYQHRHRVYDCEGETCQSCDAGQIQRIVQAQRSTFFCPTCQADVGVRRAAR